MRLITYYDSLTLSVVRRLIGPMSALAQRGHQTFFRNVSSLREIQTANYDLIFLPNWRARLHETLPPAAGTYIYDLSDPALLKDEDALHVMQQCQAVTVPVPGLVPLVQRINARVLVLPSLVSAEVFLRAKPLYFANPVIACVGDHDWRVCAEPLRDIMREYKHVQVATDAPHLAEYLGDRAVRVSVSYDTFPPLARSCALALLPRESDTRDVAWCFEFGITGVPSVASPAHESALTKHDAPPITHGDTGLVARNPSQWYEWIARVLSRDEVRVRLCLGARTRALESSVTRGADNWLARVRKLLP